MATAWEMVVELNEECIEAGNAKYKYGSEELEDYRFDLYTLTQGNNPFEIISKLKDLLEETA